MKLTSVEGRHGEDTAVSYLKKNGYKIIERNFSCYAGEIDIIAYEKDFLVFVEVRSRADGRYGHPLETVDRRKINKIVRTAQTYVYIKKISDAQIRFDVIAVFEGKCELIQNAFNVNQGAYRSI